jgi:hypothetical protein
MECKIKYIKELLKNPWYILKREYLTMLGKKMIKFFILLISMRSLREIK